MNTIAILPGGRQICSPPCKNVFNSTRQRRFAVDVKNRKVLGNQPKKTLNLNSNQNHSMSSCVSQEAATNSTLKHISTHDIQSSGAIILNQFEDLLDVKRCFNTKPG